MVSPAPYGLAYLPTFGATPGPTYGGPFFTPYPVPSPQLPPGAIPAFLSPVPVSAAPPAHAPWPTIPTDGFNRPSPLPDRYAGRPPPLSAPGSRRYTAVPLVSTPNGYLYADDPILHEFDNCAGDEDDDDSNNLNEPYPERVHSPNDLPRPPTWGQVPAPPDNWCAIARPIYEGSHVPDQPPPKCNSPNRRKRRKNECRDPNDPTKRLITTDLEYNSANLAPRPQTWRPGFDLHKSFFTKSKHKFPCWNPDRNAALLPRTIVNPMIRFTNINKYPVHYHLAREVLNYPPYNMIENRKFQYYDFMQIATTPPVRFMRIIHPLLPWYIEIQARTNPSGITIWDIFEGIYNSLHTPINSKEFYTVVLDSNDREVITQAFTYRCEGLVEEMKNGIKRVDFLGPEVWFVGLELGKYGWWTLKTLPAIGEGDL